MTSCPAVLILTFNRPTHVRRVFEVVREARPSQLFIAADGPRSGNEADERLCAEARRIVEDVDWSCEVKTLFRRENLGSKYAVCGAIDWFFEHVDEGVILEDDCVPHAAFFEYTAIMLERFRNETRIASISGTCLDREPGNQSKCRFSIYPFVWGWATWKRAWNNFDPKLRHWPEFHQSCAFERWAGDEKSARFWEPLFDRCYKGNYETAWDYPWVHACWLSGGLSIMPPVNLISNIGFGVESTHTKDTNSEFNSLETKAPTFPLQISPIVHPDVLADRQLRDRYYSAKDDPFSEVTFPKRLVARLKRNVRSMFRRFRALWPSASQVLIAPKSGNTK